MSHRKNILIAINMGLTPIILYPNWYHLPVLAFYDPENPPLMVFSFDANACNAMMYRNGKNEDAWYADPLPFFSDPNDDYFLNIDVDENENPKLYRVSDNGSLIKDKTLNDFLEESHIL